MPVIIKLGWFPHTNFVCGNLGRFSEIEIPWTWYPIQRTSLANHCTFLDTIGQRARVTKRCHKKRKVVQTIVVNSKSYCSMLPIIHYTVSSPQKWRESIAGYNMVTTLWHQLYIVTNVSPQKWWELIAGYEMLVAPWRLIYNYYN